MSLPVRSARFAPVPWLSLAGLLAACTDTPWNSPYPAGATAGGTLFASFSERPKHLDPARAYSSDEFRIIGQIYEPPLQYHYLRRPYTLVPSAAAALPAVRYLDRDLKALPDDAPDEAIAFSEYELRLQPGIRYQPHPAFARGPDGSYRYHALTEEQAAAIETIEDFAERGSRDLTADDYLYQIKRLANPELHSPIAELMKAYIVGFRDLGERIKADVAAKGRGRFLDLRNHPLAGAEVIDAHQFRLRLHGKYPQFRFWLAMPFFAPMPWEAERFYSQPVLVAKNITLDWYPVGTGAYQLTENNPNRRIVLSRNPNFHDEFYPGDGEPGDRAAGMLADAGRRLPFIDRVVLALEKETIPYWNKFLQGYYDASGLASDNFDQAVQFGAEGTAELTPEMRSQGIALETSVAASSYYLGFNLLDPVIGGLDERHCQLRQALSMAVDYEEFITIFMNGRGVAAQGMLPPGIFGHLDGPRGINPYVYDWVGDAPRRKPIEAARQRLAEAGYPRGIDAATGKPLVLYLDITARGPDDKSLLNWYRKQFEKLGIQLVLRATDYNQFQQKMANGNAQIFQWGWNADYPDPENFFFLLYGPNRKAGAGGENAANYQNERFDRLFERMRNLDDGPVRLDAIQQLQDIVRHDAPWVFGYHPKRYALHHAWYRNLKPNEMANNELKYQSILPEERVAQQRAWNRPRVWPLIVGLALFVAALVPAWNGYRRRLRAAAL